MKPIEGQGRLWAEPAHDPYSPREVGDRRGRGVVRRSAGAEARPAPLSAEWLDSLAIPEGEKAALAADLAKRSAAPPPAAQAAASAVPAFSSLAEPVAPAPTNRGGHIRQGGIDFLAVSYQLSHRRWEEVRGVLAAGKEDAQARGPEAGGLVELAPGVMGRVSPKSTGGYVRCAFIVDVDGVQLCFQDRAEPATESCPNALVTIGGRACLVHGVGWCYQRVLEVFALLGAEVKAERVTRVDLCADVPYMRPGWFKALRKRRRMVTRAKKVCLWEGADDESDVETMQVGTGDVLCRIYDKVIECESRAEILVLLQQERWGCAPRHATRVEFQIRAEVLKQFDVSDVGSLLTQLAGIVGNLTEHWLRFVDCAKDGNHDERKELSPIWRRVVQAFASWIGDPLHVAPRRKVQGVRDPQAVRQGLGCFASALVKLGVCAESVEGALCNLVQLAKSEGEWFLERLRLRAIKATLEGQRVASAFQWALEDLLSEWRSEDVHIVAGAPLTWGHGAS